MAALNEHDMRGGRISANGLGGIHAHCDHWCRIGWRDVSDIRERCSKERTEAKTITVRMSPRARLAMETRSPYPRGSEADKRWEPDLEAQELWRQLEAARKAQRKAAREARQRAKAAEQQLSPPPTK